MGKISAAQGPQGVGGGLTAPASGSRVRSCAFGTRRGDCSTSVTGATNRRFGFATVYPLPSIATVQTKAFLERRRTKRAAEAAPVLYGGLASLLAITTRKLDVLPRLGFPKIK